MRCYDSLCLKPWLGMAGWSKNTQSVGSDVVGIVYALTVLIENRDYESHFSTRLRANNNTGPGLTITDQREPSGDRKLRSGTFPHCPLS